MTESAKNGGMKKWLAGRLHQSYMFVALCIGVVVGTILWLVLKISWFDSPWWLVVAILLFAYTYFYNVRWFIIVAFAAGMMVAGGRIASEIKGAEVLGKLVGQNIEMSGSVVGDPETDETGTKFKLSKLELGEQKSGTWQSAGSVYVSTWKNKTIARGDKVIISGKLMKGFGIYAGSLKRTKIIKVKKPEPADVILGVRNGFSERVFGLVPETEAKLGTAYLLGMRSGLPEDLDESLRTVGLAHIVVASGAHLSILAGLAKKIFGKISRFAGGFFSSLLIIFFMAMVGWTPSILRAGMMSLLTILAGYVGRKFQPWRIILIVAAATLLIDPMFLINLGWLLSFAAFGGIMILGPAMTKFFYGDKKPGVVGEIVMTTVAATLMTLPISLYFFGTLSLISLIANLLILPTLPYVMGLVFLTGAVAGVPFLESAVGWIATKLLDFHILIVRFFGEQKMFLVKIPNGEVLVLLLYIIILAPFVMAYGQKRWWRKRQKIKRIGLS